MNLSLKNLPDAPGVYLMKNAQGEVIYVGKALSLKKRVASYFTRSTGHDFRPAARHLGNQVKDVRFIVTRNETEAFILENNLIKKLKPLYNIRLKDDKTFLSLCVDIKHPFPSIYPVRRPRKDGCLYFGPYSSARALRSTLRILRSVVPLRDCSHREFKSRKRACIKYQIGRCPAPCVGLIDEKSYKANLDKALVILKGKVEGLIRGLEKEMSEASASMDFEKAGRIRDQISHLKSFARSQKVESMKFFDLDVIGTYQSDGLTEVVVLCYREGKLVSSQAYTFDIQIDEADLMGQFLSRFYDGKRYIPEQTLIPMEIPDLQGISKYLRGLRDGPYSLRTTHQGDAVKLTQLAKENARQSLKASREAKEAVSKILQSLAEDLKLTRYPDLVEGIDISTTGGDEAVGAVVRFQKGAPERSRYRRYRIKTVKGMDDYAMLKEVVYRRLKKGLKEKDLPDLVLVDGGKGQLNSALDAARSLGVSTVDFLGLQKGETRARAVCVREGGEDKIVTPMGDVIVALPSGFSGMALLQRIRDEAHRFAITYHRQRRQKKGMSSPLDQVKGLGPSRKQNLLKYFGGLRELKRASLDEIEGIPGVGPVLAKRIYEVLHE